MPILKRELDEERTSLLHLVGIRVLRKKASCCAVNEDFIETRGGWPEKLDLLGEAVNSKEGEDKVIH